MLDLKTIFERLPLPQRQDTYLYSAQCIKGYRNYRVAKNYLNEPSLLIFISGEEKEFLVPNQELYNIQISHNLKCEINESKSRTLNNCSAITYIGQDTDIRNVFLKAIEVLIDSLGSTPTSNKIKFLVRKFIELFKSLKEIPRKSLQGLWAELFVIEQSNFPEILINGWHSAPEDKFDFSFERLEIEVKSSIKEERKHFFSSNQLNPSMKSEIIIASLLARKSSSGLNLEEMIKKIILKLSDFPKQKVKLILQVYSVLGTDIGKVSKVKFDYNFAQETLKFFNSNDIPKIDIQYIPKEVTNVKFISDLVNSMNLNVTIDKLLKTKVIPHIYKE